MTSLQLCGYVDLSCNQKALVDWADLEWLQKHKWYFKQNTNGTGYAARIDLSDGKRTLVSMHRAVFLRHNPHLEGLIQDIDHINMSRLDNRLSNLRAATRHQNSGNRGANKNNKSGYKGVSFYKKSNCWKAQIMDNGKKRSIGYYATPEEAALEYNVESLRIFGEFGYQNEIPEGIVEAKRLNSSRQCQPFKGVAFRKDSGKYQAYIDINRRRKHLGFFTTEAEALIAVAEAKRQSTS